MSSKVIHLTQLFVPCSWIGEIVEETPTAFKIKNLAVIFEDRYTYSISSFVNKSHIYYYIYVDNYVPFNKEWKSNTVINIAEHIVKNSDPSLMSILADALQDANCDNEELLSYIRKTEFPRFNWILWEILKPDEKT